MTSAVIHNARSNSASPLRPFAMLGTIAFVLGFVGYLGVAELTSPGVSESAAGPAYETPASVQLPSTDEWNLPKKI